MEHYTDYNGNTECWIEFYERIISDSFIKQNVLRYKNRMNDIYYNSRSHSYFLAALKHKGKLPMYEKYMILL